MQKHTKHILGAAGLMVVGVMTATAVALPGPEAQAAESSSSAGTTVSVQIVGAPLNVTITGEDDRGDPIVNTEYGAEVCSTKFQATNIATGDSLFNPEITHVIRTAESNDASAGSFTLTLPFADNGAVAGDYNIVVTACSCDGQIIGVKNVPYTYTGAKTPAVPDTGDLTLFGVNLARADYVAIGLLILAAAVACIILAVRKKNEHKK